MAYHESFWLAVAAATPVIALAYAVPITDMTSQFAEVKKLPDSSFARTVYSGTLMLSAVVFVSQATLFIEALLSLAYGKNFVVGGLVDAVTFTGGGLSWVLVVVGSAAWFRILLAREKAEMEQDGAGKPVNPDGGSGRPPSAAGRAKPSARSRPSPAAKRP